MGFVIVKKDFGGLVFNIPLNPVAERLYQSVTKGVPMSAAGVEGVDTYSALRGYLQQRGVEIKNQANVSTSAVMRLEGKVWQGKMPRFLKGIADYQEISKRSAQTPKQNRMVDALNHCWNYWIAYQPEN